jgi:hypothetical protein
MPSLDGFALLLEKLHYRLSFLEKADVCALKEVLQRSNISSFAGVPMAE